MDENDLLADFQAARQRLLESHRALLLGALQEWASRWDDPASEVGEEGFARLSASTGWPRPHLIEALRRAFLPWSGRDFQRYFLRARKSLEAVPVQDRHPNLWLLAILAGRIPALVMAAVFRALAAGVPVVLKPSSAEPVFSELLVQSARRYSDLLARAVHVVTDPDVARRLVPLAPVCLAYGRDETVLSIRRAREQTWSPGHVACTTFLGGYRESLVVVFREAASSATAARVLAEGIARDCAIYDQSGCLSPHVVLYEEGARVAPDDFARMLYESLQDLETRWPPAIPGLEEAATLRLFVEGSRVLVRATGGLVLPPRGPCRPAVILVPHGTYRPGPGHRVVQVLTFDGIPDFERQVPTLAGRLQGLAVAGPQRRLKEVLGEVSPFWAPYVCRVGRLQSPPVRWLENGRNLTRELVRIQGGVQW